MGDFNAVLLAADRVNGNAVTEGETKDFDSCMDAAGLAELKSCGSYYSWSNKGQGNLRICSRIDRAIANALWHSKFVDAVVDYLPPGISDHSPLVMSWMGCVLSKGWIHVQVWTKLKAVKQGLKELHHKDFAKLDERIEGLRADLGQIQIQLASCPTDSNVQQSERDCSETLKKFLHIQESAYRQKARIQWLQVGDSNSKFFFSAMKERIARNSIDILYDDSGKKLSTTQEIQEELSSFYKKLIGTAASSLMGVDAGVVRKGKQLSAADAEMLVVPVSDAEIDAAIKGIDINKAPGLDGFNSLFFLKAWEIVNYKYIDTYLRIYACILDKTTSFLD
ncbi:uncharacterized protein [Spinacia oleracea]|uniref:Endonuclease/exonuclease/phosphatase domain-containing protein n=1 Tax=Spinacia oleracea TaxID=3562 RepID=A0A9R0I6D4_SPIOL|nr:uncharacterized protein LOC110783445 [Spinacia oleracea]